MACYFPPFSWCSEHRDAQNIDYISSFPYNRGRHMNAFYSKAYNLAAIEIMLLLPQPPGVRIIGL